LTFSAEPRLLGGSLGAACQLVRRLTLARVATAGRVAHLLGGVAEQLLRAPVDSGLPLDLVERAIL